MFCVNGAEKRVTLHRGDTGVIHYTLRGFTFGPEIGAVALWTMADEWGEEIRSELIQLDGNELQVEFTNADTDELEPGRYLCDVRIATAPVYDGEGKLVDGTFVGTPISPMEILVLDTVGQI